MKRSWPTLLLIALVLAGCGAKPPHPPAPAGLLAISDPTVLTMDELAQLPAQDLNAAKVPPAKRLAVIYSQWYSGAWPRVTEADLNGDGAAEIITAVRKGGGGRPGWPTCSLRWTAGTWCCAAA